MRQRLTVAAAHVIRAFLRPAVLIFRLWTVVARIICTLETWSAEVLVNHAGVPLQSTEPPADPQRRGKVIPFRSCRIA